VLPPVASWPALVKSFTVQPARDYVIGLQPEDDRADYHNEEADDDWSFFHGTQWLKMSKAEPPGQFCKPIHRFAFVCPLRTRSDESA
jgi:hypothetical protein